MRGLHWEFIEVLRLGHPARCLVRKAQETGCEDTSHDVPLDRFMLPALVSVFHGP